MTTRLVCLGDSFTEGVHDDVRADGRFIGWSDRLASHLADSSSQMIEYANLAVRGKLLDQIAREQVDAAIAMSPTIVTVHAGANDVLRPKTDIAALLVHYSAVIAKLTSKNRRVIMFTSIGRAGGTGRLAQALADRFAYFNSGIRSIAEIHSALLVDLEPITVLTDRRMWHEDRLHLNAEGHARVAAATAHALGVHDARVLGGQPGWWETALDSDPRTAPQKLVSDIQWIGNHLIPWMGRRIRGVSSGDSIAPKNPELQNITPSASPT